MPDMSQVPGLLSPQENDFVRQQGMLSAAGALMKGADYSVIPKSIFGAMGDGLQAYTQGSNGAADQLLKREQLRGTIDARKLTLLQAVAAYRGAGLPVPPMLLNMLGGDPQGVGGPPTMGAPATVGGGMPQAGGAGGGMPQGMPQAPQAPAPQGMPQGLLSPTPTAQAVPQNLPQPVPMQAPAPATTGGAGLPNGVAGVIRTLPMQDRYALIGGGAPGKIVQGVLEKNLAKTEAMKDGEASGGLTPLQLKAGIKNAELTGPAKEASDAGFLTPDGKPDVAAYQAHTEGVKGLAGEKVKHIGTYIQGINPAKQSIDTLNTMEDALDRAGDKITTGPYANEMLKLKQFAQNAGVPVDGLPEAEVVSKLNAYLAGQATKAISSRPAQFEFQTYLKNNPGLLNSVQGTKKLIDVLRQQQTHALDLGQLALDDKNLKNFGDVEQNYYKTHPIVSPFSNLPLGERPKLPQGTQFNRKLMQYRDPQGNLYDAAGSRVQ